MIGSGSTRFVSNAAALLSPSLRREQALLQEVLLPRHDSPRAVERIARSGVRWAKLKELAERSAVVPMVYQSLEHMGLAQLVDPAVLSEMRAAFENQVAQNAGMLHELTIIQRVLGEHGIDFILLKGGALLLTHYPAVGVRQLDDIDLLVRSGDVHRAASLLQEEGFRPRDPRGPPRDLDGRVIDLPEFGHHLPALVSPRGVLCELHFRLGSAHVDANIDGVWERSRPVAFRGRTFTVPADVDLLGFACAHVFGRHPTEWRMFARHLVDVHHLVRDGADVQLAERLYGADETGIVRLSVDLLNSPRGQWPWAPLTNVWLPLGPASAHDLPRHVRERQGMLREHVSRVAAEGPASLIRVLFPAREHMAWRFQVDPSSPMIKRLYIRRIMRALVPSSLRAWPG